MDQIYIRDLSLRCIIGIFPEERKAKQDVVLNLTLHCDSFATAAASDDIADAVDYKTITKQVIKRVEGSEFFLIEKLAQQVADVVLTFRGVREVEVTLDKPGALRFARSVAVHIRRQRDEA